MASLATLAILNFTTFLAAILMASPVAGFLPIRAFRSILTNRPIPGQNEEAVFLDLGYGGLAEGVHHRTHLNDDFGVVGSPGKIFSPSKKRLAHATSSPFRCQEGSQLADVRH
jgi:hypothetical protein